MIYNIQDAYDFQDEIPATTFGDAVKSEEWIIMQYTGLRDSTTFEELSISEQSGWLKSNKKENWEGRRIFIGDIVKVEGIENNWFSVVFNKISLCLLNGKKEFIPFEDEKTLKVLGNAFQPPKEWNYEENS